MRREWIEMNDFKTYSIDELRLPPCGGSGLKYENEKRVAFGLRSPSMRREWIEIIIAQYEDYVKPVSLHAEGVD